MSTSNLDLLDPAVLGGVLWLLSEVLAVELNVFQVPSAGGGVFLAMALAAGTDDFDFDFDSFTSNPTCGVSAPALRVVCPNEVLRPAPF